MNSVTISRATHYALERAYTLVDEIRVQHFVCEEIVRDRPRIVCTAEIREDVAVIRKSGRSPIFDVLSGDVLQKFNCEKEYHVAVLIHTA